MLETREVVDVLPMCPAGAPVGETLAGSGCLCRITGNVLTTGENPSSLRAFCWNRIPDARAETHDGAVVEHGYQNCPPWRFNRNAELEHKTDRPFVDRHST